MKITNPQRIAQVILILATTLLLCKDVKGLKGVKGGAGVVLRGNKRVLSRIESSSTNANEAVDISLNTRLLDEDVEDVEPQSNDGKGENQEKGKNKGNGMGKNQGDVNMDMDTYIDMDDDASKENNNNDIQDPALTSVVPETDDEADNDLIVDEESEKSPAVDAESIEAGSDEDDEDDYYNAKESEDNKKTDDDKILDIDAEEEEEEEQQQQEEVKEIEDATPEPTIKATIAPTIKTSSPTMATSSPTKSPTVSPTVAATPAPTTSSPTKSLTTSPTKATPSPTKATPSPTKATPSPTKLVTILKTASPTKKVTSTPTKKVTAEPKKIAIINNDDGIGSGDDDVNQLISEEDDVYDNFEADDDRSFPSEPKSINSIEDIYDHLSPEEIDFLKHMERVDEEEEAAKISIVYFFITAALMIFTAHQLSENPDGVYSNICRLMITVTGVFFKIILLPARKFGWIGSKSGYAHHLVTTQTDFKDPYSRTNRMEII